MSQFTLFFAFLLLYAPLSCFSSRFSPLPPHNTHALLNQSIANQLSLRSLTTDATGKLDVLGHDGDALGVNSGQVRVLEKTHKVCLRRLLQGEDGAGLETEVALEILSDFTYEPLEGKLADEELGGLLVLADLTKGHGSGSISVGLLDAT